jgi:hypothetical protein
MDEQFYARGPRSIARIGYRVHLWCRACRHARVADRGDVPLAQIK